MGSRKMLMSMAKLDEQDLAVLAKFVEDGKVVPVIDRRYPLSDVREAFRYMEQKHARGKVMILPGGEAAGG
jgi:NADPH:quinone reductase-like Zn-dependent oxidoreductase